MPKVIILGAGIGGLTVAHELSKRGFEVVMYERNDIVGGLARNKYYKKAGDTYPVEYSWRIYGTGYRNLSRIFREIPLASKKRKTVYGNLVKITTFIFPRFGKRELIFSPERKIDRSEFSFTLRDKMKILDKLVYCLTMSTDRMDTMDSMKWKDFCKDLSPEAKKYMVQLWAPVLGMDSTHMSFSVIARMIGILARGYLGFPASLYLFNKPTNDAWFDEWKRYLTEKWNVTIKTGHEVKDIKMKDGRIDHVVVQGRDKKKTFRDSADYYVCSLSVESIADIVSRNKSLSKSPELKNTIPLAKDARQIQLSVQIFFNEKIKYPTDDKNVLYLPDTPWALIIEPEDVIWEKTYCTNKKVKSILSVGICQTDWPGIVHNKPFVECTEKEIQDEVMAQMEKSFEFSGIETESGKKLDASNIVLFYTWDSFQRDDEKVIDVWEPKFSNNANALKYQPDAATSIPNFFFATGYTKTDRFIFSMESAAEAGVRCANAIKRLEGNRRLSRVYLAKRSTPVLLPFIWIDKIFYRFGLPHLRDIFPWKV